jgi:F-type H+-transporting ATPase subunit b
MSPGTEGSTMIVTRLAIALALAGAAVALGARPGWTQDESLPVLGQEERAAGKAAVDLAYQTLGEEPEHKVNSSPLELKKDLALWTAVVFLVLLAVLWRFAWTPVIQGLDKREQRVLDQIAEAEQSNRKAQELLADYQRQLQAAQDRVREIVDQGRRDAEQVGQELLEKARRDADAELRRALQDIDAATAGALKDLAERSADLAVQLAGKLVRAELRPADHAALIERAMVDFTGQSPSNN